MAVATPTSTLQTGAARRQNRYHEIWRNLLRSPSGMIGLGILLIHMLLALISPFIVPYDPAALSRGAMMQAPNNEHWLGTDKLGRDVFSRTISGGRIALAVTITGTLVAVTWGGLLGILLGFLGGWFDNLVMRVVDALLAIPWLLFLLLIISAIGTEIYVLIFTLGFFYGIAIVRVVRGATLDFVARDFITAARARGESAWTIVTRELVPNVLDVLLVEGAMRWSWMLLAFSSLSFLGFGVTPPTPDWGLMIAQSRDVLSIAPWATFAPVFALSTLIIGINLTSDALAKAVGLDRSQGAPL